MDTLLTWSGEVSHAVASFFRSWLTEVLPGIEPWISSEDIAKGKKWFPELMGQLGKTGISITFVTPENIRSPWVYYEVGAIAAKNEDCIICPYLIGVEPSQVRDTPLGQFQCTAADQFDTFRLISSINDKLGAGRHNERLLKANFSTCWPKLEQVLEQATEVLPSVREDILDVEPPVEQQLSERARSLLVAAAEGESGRILVTNYSEGYQIMTAEKEWVAEQTPRNLANWKAVLNELTGLDLVEDIGYSGEVFELTKRGFEVADLIKSRM